MSIVDNAAHPNSRSKWLHAFLMGISAPLAAFVASGLFHGFSTFPADQLAIGMLIAEWLGATAIPLLVALVVLIFSSRYAAWTALAVLLAGWLALTGMFTSQPPITRGLATASEAATVSQEQPPSVASPPGRLTVTEFVQSSQGVSATDIGPQFIAGVERFLLQDKTQQYEKHMRSIGRIPKTNPLSAGSQYVSDKGNRLVVTEIVSATLNPTTAPQLKIAWWIQGNQLKLVQCADTSGNPISIRSGACGQQISRTFGYSNWALDQ